MWKFDKDLKKWLSKDDKLTKDSFDIYKQELSSYRFYSKCLSGATYLPINNLDNIYDIISQYKPRNWYISPQGSIYVNTNIPIESAAPITKDNSEEYYTKYLAEYGLTLKNKFTPERLISDSMDNFLLVDVATIEPIDLSNPPSKIDGIRLIEGHRILVKNQIINIVLSNSINPDDFFEGNFKVIENFGSDTEYQFFNEENGIYLFSNGQLIKQDDIDKYENAIRYSVSVKLGDINKDKQFHLSRLKSGYYPDNNQPIEFIENKNWLLRNQVDYNNLFELDFYDVLKHGEQSYRFQGVTYSIPERTINVGEFGIIINNQSDISNIINNKYKVNLRSISETSAYYWIVGDNGVLLKVTKHDFNIERIEVDCRCPANIIITNLKSIDFFNDLNGVAVGDLNTILITSDGGLNWERIKINSFDSYSFNKIIYKKPNRFFIAGNNGIFLDFRRDLSGWTAYRRRISRFLDDSDEFLLVDNINDLIYLETNNWNLDYTYSTQSTSQDKEIIMMVTNDSKVIIHDINSSIPFETQFFYLEFGDNYGDITNVVRRFETNQIYFTATKSGDSGIYTFNLDEFDKIGKNNPISNEIISSSQSIIPVLASGIFVNKLFDYKGDELIISGNNSTLKKSEYNTTLSFDDLDPNFESRLKSKMLFLDYDIASKLNFFTDDGDYRLPNSISFTFSNSTISFANIEDQVNWFNYWQDSQLTFEYYNEDAIIESTKVLISPTFSYSNINSENTINSITNSLSIIKNLAPQIDNPNSSRYFGTQSITEPTSSYDLYIYDYLMIYKTNIDYPVDIGDVIRLNSDIITHNFIVNKILEINGSKYIYMFTEFNGNIITNLLNETITLTNLNKFNDIDEFIERINMHPISLGYKITNEDDIVTINAKFNNLTAYYNMSAKINVDSDTYQMLYIDRFLKFGYTPTYNILDYLSEIDDSNFTENKEYLVMPDYRDIPYNNDISNSSLFIESNKIYFGEDLKFEWNSLFINTFVNINISGSSNYTNERILINKKYKIENYNNSGFNIYVVELNKLVNIGSSNTSIDIISRRTLKEISDDLQELNNIQRPLNDKVYQNDNYVDSEYVDFKTYEKLLNFKINTDSYAKILLSDLETLESITAIVYIDDKNELSMNITRVDNERIIKISNTAELSGKLLIICDVPHGLSQDDGVVLEFTGGVGSSEQLNPQYFGYRTIVEIISDVEFLVDIDYGIPHTVGNDEGFVKFINKDPFLNYQPVDMIDIGVDKKATKSIELNSNNTKLSNMVVSLVNVDFNKFRFRLVDGLNVEILASNYSWIYEAEISDAVIGIIDGELTWYKGTWECGRWFGGLWISGTWISGDWYKGVWNSKLIKDNWINIEVDDKSSNLRSSVWFNGRWFDGTWNNGTWVNGRWYDGTWNDGRWFNGIWNDGTWNDGRFTGGIWISGNWNGGVFNTENGPSFWLNGTWNKGDFENGIWYNGIWGEKLGESRFGVKSYNSRISTWHSGNWISGSFHSRLNIDNDNNYDVSNIHKYSIWRTGNWLSGNWYGGIAYNIDFKSGTWHGGILEDIQIIGFNQNEIIINGIFKFNIGDVITIIDNNNNTYPQVGSSENPGIYTILNYIEDGNKTKIYVNENIDLNLPNATDTGLKIVSNFRSCNWKSGIWNNGIYEKGLWEGGIWYDGIFNATWM